MTAPLLTPLESAIFDEDVIAEMEEHHEDEPGCECPTGCESIAVARFVILCPCRWARLGCTFHIESTKRWLDRGRLCKHCGTRRLTYRVVPL